LIVRTKNCEFVLSVQDLKCNAILSSNTEKQNINNAMEPVLQQGSIQWEGGGESFPLKQTKIKLTNN